MPTTLDRDRIRKHLENFDLRSLFNEINPDVLGYIFEKYINQKQMGAYCTKEDITGYIIRNTIIVSNLYGVDIMEEAVEICKLRLFLKLVAQLENYTQIEPLPDVDFNVRAGNTLVGFTTLKEIQDAFLATPDGQRRMLYAEDTAKLKRIEEEAEIAECAGEQMEASRRSGRRVRLPPLSRNIRRTSTALAA